MNKIDPVCLIHGKKMSKHVCLYCCLCFKPLAVEECNVREDEKRREMMSKIKEELKR